MNRDSSIDFIKGFGIILVVLAHCWMISSPMFWGIYRFHMPLFFIISGYLFSTRKNFKSFALTKVKSLLIPYFLFYLFSVVISEVLLGKHLDSESLTLIFFANGKYLSYIGNWALWYLPLFFITSIFFYLLCTLPVPMRVWLICLFVAAPLWSNYILCLDISNIPDGFIPFSIQVLVPGLFFMTLGKELKTIKDVIFDERNRTTRYCIAFIMIVVGYYFTLGSDQQIISIHDWIYCLSGSLIAVGIIILLWGSRNHIVEYAGNKSLIILGVHRPMLEIANIYLSPYISNISDIGMSDDFMAILLSLAIVSLILLCCKLFEFLGTFTKTSSF